MFMCGFVVLWLTDFCMISAHVKNLKVQMSLDLCSSWLHACRLLPQLEIRCTCGITCTAMSFAYTCFLVYIKIVSNNNNRVFLYTYLSYRSFYVLISLSLWIYDKLCLIPGGRCLGLLCHCGHWKAARCTDVECVVFLEGFWEDKMFEDARQRR